MVNRSLDTEEAEKILALARRVLRPLAIVHLAAAQFELTRGKTTNLTSLEKVYTRSTFKGLDVEFLNCHYCQVTQKKKQRFTKVQLKKNAEMRSASWILPKLHVLYHLFFLGFLPKLHVFHHLFFLFSVIKLSVHKPSLI